MTVEIHPTAILDPKAQLGENVKIGAFSVIGPHVAIGDNCVIHSHVILKGHLKIGNDNTFFQFASIGETPQDKTYKNEPTEVVIGNGNVFREYISVHRGTLKGGQITCIGNNNFLMSYTHIAHDVSFGSYCVVANTTNFAGHVCVEDYVTIGGGCNFGQFVTLGKGCYIGGGSVVDRDIPPFCAAYGNRVRLKGPNIIGMKRQGYSQGIVIEVVDFYRGMEASPLSSRAFVNCEKSTANYKDNNVVNELSEFIKKSKVGIAPFFTA